MIAAPYDVALIQIDSGPLIEAVSTSQLDERKIATGEPVELVLEALGEDEGGEEIAAYRFKLAGEREEKG